MQQEITSGFRVSPQQKRLWLLQQADSTQPYRVQLAIGIEGNLDRKRLKMALENTVSRHEILRTTFHCLPGMSVPLQVIRDPGIAWGHDCNFSGLDSSEQTDKLEARWDELLQIPFDFEKGSLLQVSLVELSSHNFVLFISLPALCGDAIALEILIYEISRSYGACLQGKELSDEPLQYADLAEWQNELLESDEWQAGQEYWRKQDISIPLNWKHPFENQPNETLDFHPSSFDLIVHPAIASKIITLSQHHNVSLPAFLVTCWQILLWKLIGQSNILVGIACNGRKYEGLDDALGLFLRYLPLQINLADNYQFVDVLKEVNESIQDISLWQEYFTWEQIIRGVEPENSPSFFPFCFEFEELSPQKFTADVTFSIEKRYACTDRFKLKLLCRRQDNSLITEFHYDANVFFPEDIRCLAEQFCTLLASISQHPDAQLSELEIVSDIERHQLLFEFNTTKVDYPQTSCIHHLFEEQVTRTPNNIAVVFENQQLTYAELNNRANQLAGYLRQLGVGLEVPVAICVERSIEMVVGILGILKAGGAYVPLDPTYPKDRLAFILEDTQTPVLLTEKHLLATLPDYSGQAICLDTDGEALAGESQENSASSVTADNLAYIIYTSGSTGKPKGVLVTHGNLVHSTCDRITFYRQPVESFLLLSSVAFDSSVAGLFWTLCQGGSLVLPPDGVQRELPQLLDLLAHHRISHLLSLPSLYALLLEQANPQQLVSLQTVIVAGESCTQELVEHHYQRLPQASLFNEYGPTEGTVWSSVYPCRPKELRSQVPIGRPIANTQIYLLDSRLQPVAIGVTGELYISGLGLARGYLNQPELTAERFIPNPFSDEPGARLYKTGDLARYRTDGSIEFLGRCDRQVKLRGFRIELGEIEAVLTQHPAISEAVVSDWDDESGTKRLVAYIVAKPESTPTTDELHQFLLQQLPQYMVPANIVLLSVLPRLPNGKVNHKALPAPETAQPKTYVAPRTPLEKLLADIWVQVLGLEQVGIHDNFFELGGDSILSIQIIAKANQAGFQFTTKQLFERPTIAELATVAGTTQRIQAEQGLVTGSIPLIPIQHWFFNQNLTDPHHWNQVVLLEVPPDLNLTLIEPAFRALLRHHDVLRLRFEQTASGWQQVNASPDDIVPLTQYDLSTLAPEEQAPAIESTATQLHQSLNLSAGPLMRVALFNLGANQASRLLIIIHHLAVDGVSWQILLEDFQTAYEQLKQGEAIQLPAKTTSFQQWSQRLQQYATSTSLQQELDYWLAQSRRPVAPIPVDFTGGDNIIASAHLVSVALSVEETRSLLQKVPAAYRTQINDVLLTAVLQAFREWTGERRLLVDFEGHGREELFEDADLSRTVGWFTSIFPLLLELENTADLGEALQSIKEQLRRIPNRGIGYGVLRYLSGNPEIVEQLQALPQPEVSFNYLGQLDQVLPESSTFKPAREPIGPPYGLRGTRSHLLNISGFVDEGRLRMYWTYSDAVHQRRTIEQLAQSFMTHLRSLIAHCQAPDAGGYTASDFPLLDLSQDELSAAFGRIRFEGG